MVGSIWSALRYEMIRRVIDARSEVAASYRSILSPSSNEEVAWMC